MKNLVYYFSGTGNSLAAAKRLAAAWGDCELVSIADAAQNGRYRIEADTVGFVFPLYYVNLPRIVQGFIERAEFAGSPYIYAVVTKGFPVVGSALGYLGTICSAKGQRLSFASYVLMPNNDIVYCTVPDERRARKLNDAANAKLDRLFPLIERQTRRIDPEPLGFIRKARQEFFLTHLKTSWKSFYANERCTGCGLCARSCPVKNISMANGKPVWGSRCEECEGCLHLCPVEAAQHGNTTQGKRRYWHPAVPKGPLT